MARSRKPIRALARHQKRWYGKWHVWLGLTAGTIIFIVSLTGTALVYRDEIDQALNPAIFELLEQQEKLSYDQILAQVKRDHPAWDIQFIFESEGGPNLPYQAFLRDSEQQVFINPYTGAVTGSRIHDSSLMGFLLEVHRTLLIPVVGRYIVGISALILVILTISGLRLWIPKKWKHLKSRLTIRRDAGVARQNYDLHQVLGFYFSPFILLIALTGVIITFTTVIVPVMYLLSFEPPRTLADLLNSRSAYTADVQPIGVDSAIAIVLKEVPDASIAGVVLPADSAGVYAVYTHRPYITETGDHDFFYIDQYSGKINLNTVTGLPNTGKMYLNWVTPIHYGTFGGNATRVVAFVASLIPSILFITGIIIWYPRWRGKKGDAKKAAAVNPARDTIKPRVPVMQAAKPLRSSNTSES